MWLLHIRRANAICQYTLQVYDLAFLLYRMDYGD